VNVMEHGCVSNVAGGCRGGVLMGGLMSAVYRGVTEWVQCCVCVCVCMCVYVCVCVCV
jgi:hypothetical protein